MNEIATIIHRLSEPLSPQPTGVEPRLPALPGIRVVLFDIYGTLLISASGDISLTSGAAKGEAATEALAAVGVSLGVDGQQVVDSLLETIQTSHAESDVEYPEVDIVATWQATVQRLSDGEIALDDATARRLATEYECRVNSIWPMPGLADLLDAIATAGLRRGIVSNAQFFTPQAFPALAGKSLAEWGFEERLSSWSYAHLQAKPGTFLYQRVAEALAANGIQPAEVLYVGNDMRNDIWPAAEVGFRTALFAGDARSLRWREDDPRVAGLEPDAVVTELGQLLTILSLAGR
ncbi:MAG: HAD family hydrolase [Planctomycetota bacterium]